MLSLRVVTAYETQSAVSEDSAETVNIVSHMALLAFETPRFLDSRTRILSAAVPSSLLLK